MWKAIIAMLFGTIIVAIGDGLLSKGLRELQTIECEGNFFMLAWSYVKAAFRNPILILGVVCHMIFFVSLLLAFSWGDLSLVLPINALTYLFAALIAKYYLHEDVNALRWIGTIVIVAGVFIVLLGQGKDEDAKKQQDSHSPAMSECAREI